MQITVRRSHELADKSSPRISDAIIGGTTDEIGGLNRALYAATDGRTFGTIDDVPYDTWKRLQSLGMIDRGPKSEPFPSKHGWNNQSRIESGRPVSEFDKGPPISARSKSWGRNLFCFIFVQLSLATIAL
jgi:hypothetical protein